MPRHAEAQIHRSRWGSGGFATRRTSVRAKGSLRAQVDRTLPPEAPAIGGTWMACAERTEICPLAVPAPSGPITVDTLHLSFSVSRDEQHVQLRALVGERTYDLGWRVHNYLLLVLARRRLADRAEGFPEPECGWIDPEEWAHDPTMSPAAINTNVLRIRRQIEELGLANAASVVERRRSTRQLRIGTERLTVRRV